MTSSLRRRAAFQNHVSCFNCFEQTVLAKLDTTRKDLPGCWGPSIAARITPETLLQEVLRIHVSHIFSLCGDNTRSNVILSTNKLMSVDMNNLLWTRAPSTSTRTTQSRSFLRCPYCRDPFYEWQNCGAVVCEGCETEFCVACLGAFHDVHKHIRDGCTALQSHGVSFSRHDFALMTLIE